MPLCVETKTQVTVTLLSRAVSHNSLILCRSQNDWGGACDCVTMRVYAMAQLQSQSALCRSRNEVYVPLCASTQRLSDSQSHTASYIVSHNTLRRSHNAGGVSVTVSLCHCVCLHKD